MGRKQKHNRLTIEQGGVKASFTMEHDGSVVAKMDGTLKFSGVMLDDLAEMFAVGSEQQREARELDKLLREAARQRRLSEEPIPEQPEGLPEF